MTRSELFTERRSFLFVLATVMSVGFTVLVFFPSSPGHLRWTTFVAVGLTAAVAIAAALAGTVGRARQVVAVVVLTSALALAIAGSDPGHSADLYILWFPWIAIYGAMSASLPVTIADACIVTVGAVAAMTSHTDLADGGGPITLATVLSVAFAALLVHAFSNWSRVQVDRDPLTRLDNRAGLLRRADPALARSVGQGGKAVLMLIDIDRFREVNNALGHDVGDELLRLIARELRTVTPEPLFLGRLGSDEFALVIDGSMIADPPTAAAEQLRGLGRAVLGQICGPHSVNGVAVEVEASAGIAVAPGDGGDLSALLPCADAALHRAKRDGERVGVWDVGMAGVRPWEIALYAELRTAISQNELVLYYQPLLSAHTRQVAGVEALVRWRHPKRGLLPPGAFIPMAERSALIVDVTEWVLDDALRQCASWSLDGLHVPVSVNLSARMLVMDELPGMVSDALDRHGLPPDVLTLEITESAFVTQPARAAAILHDLRIQGVKLSLDDFGTGYSSMEILKAFPFDEVKIDRGFVSDARGNHSDAAIVSTVLDLGHRLGLQVVGEGVEDHETFTMMTALGCDILQGDVVSPPLPPAGLHALLTAGALLDWAGRASSSDTAGDRAPNGTALDGTAPDGAAPHGAGPDGAAPDGAAPGETASAAAGPSLAPAPGGVSASAAVRAGPFAESVGSGLLPRPAVVGSPLSAPVRTCCLLMP